VIEIARRCRALRLLCRGTSSRTEGLAPLG
jgi:hypothetical protein